MDSLTRAPGGYSVSYDANGNLTNDGFGHTYTWNAEGAPRTVSDGTSSTTVIYDALGRAVENQRGTTYTQMLYGVQGNKLALLNGSSLVKAFMPLVAGSQAVYDSTGLLYYRHPDWLGSARLASTPARTVYSSIAYAPYGEDYAPTTGTVDKSFTGQNQDTTSGIYDFMFRRYSPMQGRWISPDPAGLAAVDPRNPQSWNRYAYVTNRSLDRTDPLGLDEWIWCPAEVACHGVATGGHIPRIVDGVERPDHLDSAYDDMISNGSAAVCPNNYCPTQMVLRDIGAGYASFYMPNPNLLLNCTNYTGNAQEQCRWSRNSQVWVADVDPPIYGANGWGQKVLSHPTLQTAASTMTDARTYAVWTAAAAVPAVIANWGALSASASDVWLNIEAANPGVTFKVIDVINVLTPPVYLPQTWPGFATCAVTSCWDPNP